MMTLHIDQTGDLIPRMKAKFGGKPKANPMVVEGSKAVPVVEDGSGGWGVGG